MGGGKTEEGGELKRFFKGVSVQGARRANDERTLIPPSHLFQWALSQKKIGDTKEKKIVPKTEEEKREHRATMKKKKQQEEDAKAAAASVAKEMMNASGQKGPITELSASGAWRKSRTSQKDWKGMMEASLRKLDFSNVTISPLPRYNSGELLESFAESFANEEVLLPRDLLYTKTAFMTHPVDKVSKNTSYAAAASSPFNRTLREEYVLGERKFKREQEKKKERRRMRELVRKNKRPKQKKVRKPPEPEPEPEVLYDPTEEITEEEVHKYFGAEAKKEYFSIFRKLETQKNVIPVNEDIRNYKAPSFDDSSMYSVDEDDEEGSILLEDHEYGIYSKDALTPRHRMNREIIAMTTVVSEPSLIRSNVLNQDSTGVNDTINLSGKSLGDSAIQVLAGILDEIPCIRHINLRDNRLSDETIQLVIGELTNPDKEMNLQSLDLSYNDIDSETAVELANFLSADHCVLNKLCLANSDLDDIEIAAFSESLRHNKTITSLDFSHNIIGGARELLHKTAPNFDAKGHVMPTGGEALASALGFNKTLTELNLGWNQMGPKSASVIGEMLSNNSTLKWLDLGYNSLQDSGVQEIFNNLVYNESLTHLDVSSNQVGPAATSVLGNILRENETLIQVNLVGNPIQELGVRAIIRSLKYSVPGRVVDLTGCNFDKRHQTCEYGIEEVVDGNYHPPPPIDELDKSTKLSADQGVTSETHMFDYSDPMGYYNLDMTVPYNQAIVHEMYYLASYSSGYYFKLLKHKQSPQHKVSPVKLKPPKETNTMDLLKKRRRTSVILGRAGYEQPQSPSTEDPTAEANPQYDTNWRYQTTSIYTELELDEWRKKMEECALLDSSFNLPWRIPTGGTLEIVFAYVAMPQAETMLANKMQLEGLLGWCEKQPDKRMQFMKLFAIDGFVLTHQVQDIVDQCNHGSARLDDSETLEMLRCLVPICVDSGAVEHVFEHNLSHRQMTKLVNEFGALYNVLQGSYSGHYSLDLGFKWDRLALIKLAEQNCYETSRLRDLTAWQDKNGGTSQHGDWSQFRNGTFKKPGKRPYALKEPSEFFAHRLMDKVDGIFEFDFVSTERIAGHTKAMTTPEFENMCRTCGVFVAPTLTNQNLEQLTNAVAFVQKNAEKSIGGKDKNKSKEQRGRLERLNSKSSSSIERSSDRSLSPVPRSVSPEAKNPKNGRRVGIPALGGSPSSTTESLKAEEMGGGGQVPD